MQLLMPNPRCPLCGAKTERDISTGKQLWVCARCARRFRFSRTYTGALAWIAMGLSFLSAYILGARNWVLLTVGLVMWFPVLSLFAGLAIRIIPPPLDLYSDFGDGSHFTSIFESEVSSSSMRPNDQNSHIGEQTSPPKNRTSTRTE